MQHEDGKFDADEVARQLSKSGRAVTARTLAAIWGCATREVRPLAELGVAVRIGSDRFDSVESTKNYIKHLRELAAARQGHEKSDAGASAGVRLKDAKVRLLDLQLQRQTGLLVPLDDVRAVTSPIIRQLRQAILGLPGAICFDVPTITQRDKKTLDRVVRDALNAFAEGRDLHVKDAEPK